MQLLRTLLLLVGADALRKFKQTSKTNVSSSDIYPRGVVGNLYTFGAPKVSAPELVNPNAADGCFPGYRVVNKNKKLIYDVDIVPTLMISLPYAHQRIDPLFLFQDMSRQRRDCGWSGRTVEKPNTELHAVDTYIYRAGLMPALKDAASVALAVSYVYDAVEAAKFVRDRGFGLAGTAFDAATNEASHLIQNPNTLDCFITFEGSTNTNDWIENAQIARTRFCGLEQPVHTGFKKATLGIVAIDSFKRNVRPFLGHCRTVEAVGHSLGGAIATLFTACAHNEVRSGQEGFEDFQHFWFKKLDTKRLNYLQ